MGVVRSVLELGPRRWPFLLRVTASAVVIEVAVRLLPLRTVSRIAGVALDGVPSSDGDGWLLLSEVDSERCRTALRVIGRPPLAATCLRRSLVLGHLLRHRRPVLRVGVAKRAGIVAAHAWIEVDGHSLDATSGDYRVLPAVAGRSAARGVDAAAASSAAG